MFCARTDWLWNHVITKSRYKFWSSVAEVLFRWFDQPSQGFWIVYVIVLYSVTTCSFVSNYNTPCCSRIVTCVKIQISFDAISTKKYSHGIFVAFRLRIGSIIWPNNQKLNNVFYLLVYTYCKQNDMFILFWCFLCYLWYNT